MEGFPREVQASGERWEQQATHERGPASPGVNHRGNGVMDDRNRPRDESTRPGTFSKPTHDRTAQTPLDYDPRLRVGNQQYDFGGFSRVNGRLWWNRARGEFYIVPADPCSSRWEPLHDNFVAAGPAGELWWDLQREQAMARVYGEEDGAYPWERETEPRGDGWSGDEDEFRPILPAIIDRSGSTIEEDTTASLSNSESLK